MSVPTGLRASVSRRHLSRRQKMRVAQQPARRRPIFECLEERRVLAVAWDVQSDFFAERNTNSQSRSLRSFALSADDQQFAAGFINGSSTSGIRVVNADSINAELIGNGFSSADALAPNPVYNVGVAGALGTGSQQPRGLATDDRGNVYAAFSSSSWKIYNSNLSSEYVSRSVGSAIYGISVVKSGGNYYAYLGYRNGTIERHNVNDPLNPVLDTTWGASGAINLKTYNSSAYINNLEVDADGTIFVAGGLSGSPGNGNALIKVPAAAAQAANYATVTAVTVGGGASGTGLGGAMDVALYAGKVYITQYGELNSTISAFYKLDLSSAGNITPNITGLIGPSGLATITYPGELTPSDRGFAGIDISADGRIYVVEQLYAFATSYLPTNPGAVAYVGNRFYFDRILVSTALDVEGPVTSAALVNPNPATAGAATQVTLTANINDTSTSGSTIAAAEYSVNGGADWTLMNAVDGVFDSVAESVTTTFTLGSASFSGPGSYDILVRGIDTAGQTGAAVTVTLEVEGLAPSITSVNTATFTVGIADTFSVTTTADPTAAISFTGTLPSGVGLVDNGNGTATLSGTPALGTQGSYSLTITASNGVAPEATQSFTLVVNPPPVDYGDAPDSYGTTLAANGARHASTGPMLGATRDVEADGQPNAAANGDGADEDGVTLPNTLIARVDAQFVVNTPTGGRLDAWIDYNRDGDFLDANEQVVNGRLMNVGTTFFGITVPAGIVAGASFARFRLSSAGGLGPTGSAPNGEVEDYPVNLAVPTPGSITVVTDPATNGPAMLLVQGTNNFYETISVQPTAGQPGKVTASISPGMTLAGIDLASFERIVIFGEGGIDSITVANSITKPATIFGDAGFDTINGGGGDDTIVGGPDYDSLNGNGGDDTFIAGTGFDSVNGGAGFDSLHKTGSGTFNMSNYALTNGSDYVSHSGLEEAVLTGGANADTFSFAGWTGKAFAFGGGGSNTLVDSADANYVLGPSSLTRTIGAATSEVVFLDIQNVNLTGGFGNNTFNLAAWTGTAVVNGGYFGTDTVILAGDVNYNLTDAILQRPSFGMVRLSGIDNAVITGGGSANTFNITNWSSAATLNGESGNDKVVAAGNVNFTLSDTSLTRSTGGTIALSSIQEADISGGAGNNVINGAAFTGTIKFDGAGGNDTLTSGSGAAILLGGAGNDTLNAGSGRAFLIGGLGLDTITGGSNSDLIVDGQTTSDNDAAALAHILADWISALTYDQRADHVIADHLGGTNVIHDGSVDILLGAGDDDLFFAKLDAPNLDSIGDKVGIERSI